MTRNQIEYSARWQDEVTRVVNEVRELLKNGVALGDILIIHADWQGVDRLSERLRREFGAAATIDPKDAPKGNQIRVVTLNAATGLESETHGVKEGTGCRGPGA